MAGFLGADVEQLLQQSRASRTSGTQIGELVDVLQALCSSVGWTGPDADTFRETFDGRVAPAMRDCAGMLDSGSRSLAEHAAQQELASDPDSRIDTSRYADLIGGQGWSDIINDAQDVWDWEHNPFSDPMDISELGGRYIDTEQGKDFDPADVDLSEAAIADQVMRQGALGDCWFLAALMSVSDVNPGFLAENITLQDDGTWKAILYEDGKEVPVTVSPDQLARDGARVDDDGEESFWRDDPIGYMSIYEQAAINHLGPDYESVIADTPGAGLELVTGQPAGDRTMFTGKPSLSEIETALSENRPITAMSDPIHPWRDDIASAHVYQVQSVDAETGEITLVNPWGNSGTGDGDMPHTVRVSHDDFLANFPMSSIGARAEDFGEES